MVSINQSDAMKFILLFIIIALVFAKEENRDSIKKTYNMVIKDLMQTVLHHCEKLLEMVTDIAKADAWKFCLEDKEGRYKRICEFLGKTL